MNLPVDWPRINQFPEWFTVAPESRYLLSDQVNGKKRSYSGEQLHEGVALSLKAGIPAALRIELERRP